MFSLLQLLLQSVQICMLVAPDERELPIFFLKSKGILQRVENEVGLHMLKSLSHP